MTTPPPQTPTATTLNRAQRLANWLRDGSLALLAVLLVLAVAGSGWSASFISLHEFATTRMLLGSSAAWLVPGTFDGAALGLSLLAFRAATHGRASLGSRVYVYSFTALSSWINYLHITDPQGRIVACLLPIAAVVVFDKLLKEAREAYERRNGKRAFRVRPGLLLLRLLIDRDATKAAIKNQITDIPVEALIGLGAGNLARDATAALPQPAVPDALRPLDPVLYPEAERRVSAPFRSFTTQVAPFTRTNTLPPTRPAGSDVRNAPMDDESDEEAARRMRAGGMPYGQIAAALGRSKTWVYNTASASPIEHANGHHA